MTYQYVIRIVDGRHVVGATTDGLDFYRCADFATPRKAVRYADMRQANVSPLRLGPVLPLPAQGEAANAKDAASTTEYPVRQPSISEQGTGSGKGTPALAGGA